VSEVLDSRTTPEKFPPGVRGPSGPDLPRVDYRDTVTVLDPANLRRLLLEVRADHESHHQVPFYSYVTTDCDHFNGFVPSPLNEDGEHESVEEMHARLADQGEHAQGVCLDEPDGTGCRECESVDCERVCDLEVMAEVFWDTIGQGNLS
jgi:hypothetical protein